MSWHRPIQQHLVCVLWPDMSQLETKEQNSQSKTVVLEEVIVRYQRQYYHI